MRDGTVEGTSRPSPLQAMAWVIRAGGKSQRSQRARILTQEGGLRAGPGEPVRPRPEGWVLQERKHRLCNLSSDPSSITYYPGDLEQAISFLICKMGFMTPLWSF